MSEPMETPEHIIRRAIELYEPTHIFGLFSGGDDSLTVTHFAKRQLGTLIDAIVHINTGIGLPETRAFVDAACSTLGWNLLEYKAKDLAQDYEQIVLQHGFPGPSQHLKMFVRLKERALDALVRDHKGGHVMLISGVRQQESTKRMKLSEPVHKDGRKIWCAPFFYWSNDQVGDYRATLDLPKNPAKEYLCMSGECLCGAFARPNELKEIELWFPETGQYLRDLERRVKAAGFPWGWDEAPPSWWSKMQASKKAGQADAFEQERDDEIQMLCTTCQFKHENAA
jgi:3'-phosphoadenosine 5'-phosphosulfate sulfotransferase (PAPS reductase)/FAD synthetase